MIFMINNNNVLNHKHSILIILYRYIFCYNIEIIYYFEINVRIMITNTIIYKIE